MLPSLLVDCAAVAVGDGTEVLIEAAAAGAAAAVVGGRKLSHPGP